MHRSSIARRSALVAVPLLALLASCELADELEPSALPMAAQVVAPERPGLVGHPSTATVSGPVTGGKGTPFSAMPKRLVEQFKYVEEEFFIEGSATSFTAQGALGPDGKWTLAPAGTAPYKTRILVRRPDESARFSGVVFVEWLNVSAGVDSDPAFMWSSQEALRGGDIFVGVSAQAVGVQGGGFVMPGTGNRPPLKTADPERYGSLSHPGDAYSYDIFTQVADALRAPKGVDPLRGIRPRYLLATGESQSAGRLVSYVNGVHPLALSYDGFVIQSRGGPGSGFDARSGLMQPTRIRTDLKQPVLQFMSETDVAGMGFLQARQPDTEMIRTWEVAGTAHADKYLAEYGSSAGGGTPSVSGQCASANEAPKTLYKRRALADMRVWMATGKPPASGTPFQTQGNTLARDKRGIVLGGIRGPHVDVPIAVHSGVGSGSPFDIMCGLFGSTKPLDAATLRSLYPTHAEYVQQVEKATDAAIAAGFLLEVDRAEVVEAAQRAAVPPL